MARIVVVGAGGFIGRAVVARLAADGVEVVAVARRPIEFAPAVRALALGDLSPRTTWQTVLAGARVVIHLASRAHAPLSGDPDPWIAGELAAARHLASEAIAAGVTQMILLSSIKVHGETTAATPFRADQPLAPADVYGHAKARLETAMRETIVGSGTALAIIRPPLVYGPEVKGNFRALLDLVRRAPVLPLGGIANRRSLLCRDNLVDLLARIAAAPAPVTGAYLARDDQEIGTSELLRRIGRHLGRVPLLLPCPVPLLRLAARALRRAEAIDRLTQSLQVDDRPTRAVLGWRPPVDLDAGLAGTCRWYLEQEKVAR